MQPNIQYIKNTLTSRAVLEEGVWEPSFQAKGGLGLNVRFLKKSKHVFFAWLTNF